VTNTNQVCLTNPETAISNPGLDELIEASAHVSLFTFFIGGAEMLCLRLDGRSFVYSAGSGLWSEFTSYGESNWLPRCAAGQYFGSADDGRLFQWGNGHSDLGGVLERRFRAGFPLNSGGVTINNIVLRCNIGNTPFVTGDYDEPVVEMRRSLDGGRTWGVWRQVSLGRQGEYRKKVQWTGCGMAGQPGWMSEFRVTDPVDFRASEVLVNEAYGGI
jgi:hypothetical protein